MLLELRIDHLATIEQVAIAWQPGFNILTGETGAGKSIIIGALNLVLGERATVDVLRTGADMAAVEAVFQLSNAEVRARIQSLTGLEDLDNELILRREIMSNGRSRAMLNGRTVTVGMLAKVREVLVEIHGQHEHQALLDARNHLDFIDEFGSLTAERDGVRELCGQLDSLTRQMHEIELQQVQREQRGELLRFQREELDRAQLRTSEEAELDAEKKVLANVERVKGSLESLFALLYEKENSLVETLGAGARELQKLTEIDHRLDSVAAEVTDILFRIEDAADKIREHAQSLHDNPARLEQVEDRLHFLHELQRKYHCDLSGLLAYRAAIDQELEALGAMSRDQAALQEQHDALRSRLFAAAQSLSQRRHEVAQHLKQLVESELGDLDMAGAIFDIGWAPLPDDPSAAIKPKGIDEVEFLLSANVGETVKPLATIASGGELSRIMLALKHAFVLVDQTPTLIFDEIDAGIGGKTAEAVGRKLAGIAARRQVLCVTHLPQIAAMADHHFVVKKHAEAGRTITTVNQLGNADRNRELTRMLEGEDGSDATKRYVEALLQRYRPQL